MIELRNVNKYFNKHKKNQIHVINDTSLKFDNTGLVALLGPSGSGKTTLLNTIGGLDNINSGAIYLDGKKITTRFTSKKDELRNLNIGYIFQDYKLVESMTVFDNVSLSLKLIGVKDKEEIKKRVLYTLEKVNMVRFKNRPVTMLSGGERQRVGIARALVKNPKIIIADEPTGNLDSKNSLEVMNIIKSISKKYLVILVTHEEELARFYADRIIELEDGKVIKDYKNKYDGTLNYEIENRVYLKDYNNIDKIKKDNINIEVYRNSDEKIDLKIVFRNGNIYIDSNNNEKIEVKDTNSNIEFINDHYKEIKDIEIKEDTFDIESISNNNKKKYSSIFKLLSFISYGFKNILNYSFIKKILLIGFILSGMFIFYSVSSICATLTINENDFILMNRDYLIIEQKKLNVDDYLSYEKNPDIDYILPGNSYVTFLMNYDNYLQTQDSMSDFRASLSDINRIKKEDLIYGRLPENDHELVVDKLALTKFIKDGVSKMAGLIHVEDFLDKEIKLNNLGQFVIVGVVDNIEPSIYMNKELFINALANSNRESYEYDDEVKYVDYALLINNKVKLVKGRVPSNDYEVIVNELYKYDYPLNKKINYKINKKKLKVVGYYKNIENSNIQDLLVNNNTIKYKLINESENIVMISKDSEKTINEFRLAKKNIYNSYDYSKKNYMEERKDSVRNALIISGIILGISLVEILLMIRSSFLSRIKEVGIFRAVGVKKSDIYKMFAGEILSITTIASVPGILLMSYILKCLSEVPYLDTLFKVNLFTILFSIILVYIFNLIVGLLPVFNTIRKTPSEILSRQDVD